MVPGVRVIASVVLPSNIWETPKVVMRMEWGLVDGGGIDGVGVGVGVGIGVVNGVGDEVDAGDALGLVLGPKKNGPFVLGGPNAARERNRRMPVNIANAISPITTATTSPAREDFCSGIGGRAIGSFSI